MLSVFYAAAAIAVLLIGAGVFYAAIHVVHLLKHVRLILLPQVELTLTEVQKNLSHIQLLTAEVDTTVESANQMVASANRTVQTVEETLTSFNKRVALPMMIGLSATREGVVAAWKALRSRRDKPAGIVVIQEPPATTTSKDVAVLQPSAK